MKTPGNELASAVVDSLCWMQRWTKTKDEQDPIHPYKPLPLADALTYFWTMGSNLADFPEFDGLGREQLARALAERAKATTTAGRDGVLAVDYIRTVHEFGPDDAFTAEIARNL